jgi:hypothetical protein
MPPIKKCFIRTAHLGKLGLQYPGRGGMWNLKHPDALAWFPMKEPHLKLLRLAEDISRIKAHTLPTSSYMYETSVI